MLITFNVNPDSIEKILGSSHACTYSKIGQHAPIENIKEAMKLMQEKGADVIVGAFIWVQVYVVSKC